MTLLKSTLSRAIRQLTDKPIVAVCFLSFVFYYLVFFPGIIREDSSDQLGQALRHDINDWHSPVMTLIWSWTNEVYVGPAGMLLLSDIFFFAGLAILLQGSLLSLRKQLNVLLLVTLFPINFCLIGDVTKTSFFCSTLLLAIGLAGPDFSRALPRLVFGLLSFGLLLLAIAIRPDGIAAALPIFGWLIWRVSRTFVKNRMRGQIFWVGLGSLAAALGCYLTVGKVNSVICHGRQTHPEQVFLATDLVALSVDKNRLLVPGFILKPGTDLNRLRGVYHPSVTSNLYWGQSPPLRRVASESDFQALASTWKEQIARYPFLYLKERAKAVYYFLGPPGFPYAAPTFSVVDNTWGYFPSLAAVHADFRPGYLSSVEVLFYYYSRNWFFEKPGFFLFLSLLNVAYLLRNGGINGWRDQVSLVLASSGLAHLALLFLFTPEADYRYSSWLILSSSLSCLLTLMGRFPSEPSPESINSD